MSTITPWKRKEAGEESRSLRSFQRDIDSLFEGFFRGFGFPAIAETGNNLLSAKMDIAETDKEYYLSLEMPGVDEKEIDISLSGDLLTIKGEKKSEEKKEGKNYLRIERSYGSVQRAVTLPEGVNADNIKANFKNGVLDIIIPKAESTKPEVKKIAVKNS